MFESIASFPLTVPILTGLLALFGSWVGSFLGRTTEHKQWKRNQKVETYMDFLEVARPLDSESLIGTNAREGVDSLHHHLLRIRILGSSSVIDAAHKVQASMRQITDYAKDIINDEPMTEEEETKVKALTRQLFLHIDALIDAIRDDLKVA